MSIVSPQLSVSFHMSCPVCSEGEMTFPEHNKTPNQTWTNECGQCCSRFKVIRTGDSIEVTQIPNERIPSYLLLQIDPKLTKEPIYVVRRNVFMLKPGDTDVSSLDITASYVEDHTDPTELIGCKDVAFGIGDGPGFWNTDCHGLFKYIGVRSESDVRSNVEIADVNKIQSHEYRSILIYLLHEFCIKDYLS